MKENVEREMQDLTIAVLGGGGVGKSSIIVRLLYGDYQDNCFDPTLLDEYCGQAVFENIPYRITFMDTAGQEQYYDHRKEVIGKSDGYLLVYDVTDRLSFDEIDVYVNELCRIKYKDSSEIPIVIAANKSEVQDREISTEEGEKYAKECDCAYIEVSAKSGSGLDQCQNILLNEVRYYQNSASVTGYIWILGRTAKKRWCILKKGVLSLYKGIKLGKPASVFNMAEVLGIRYANSETKRPHAFAIKLLQKTVLFCSASKNETEDWVNAIRRHASKMQHGREIGTGQAFVNTVQMNNGRKKKTKKSNYRKSNCQDINPEPQNQKIQGNQSAAPILRNARNKSRQSGKIASSKTAADRKAQKEMLQLARDRLLNTSPVPKRHEKHTAKSRKVGSSTRSRRSTLLKSASASNFLYHAKTLKKHVALDEDSLSFSRGEIIKVFRHDKEQNRYYGIITETRKGWFPSSLVETTKSSQRRRHKHKRRDHRKRSSQLIGHRSEKQHKEDRPLSKLRPHPRHKNMRAKEI
eukprot:TRINITY_DN2517_c0_g1_i1.p1 TRINITY_DN2517_c0_g1~~TRINITY_DN2517_c0_g1_i1.p1  ORF type:complete len:522 (-),score=58.37 TRINITY_DN2517_c0_g1_i1:40-1605(-)